MDPELQAAWHRVQDKLLFPTAPRTHPYYVCAPPWVQSSAGIRALYLLCHSLNRLGFEAYVTHEPLGPGCPPSTTTALKAPILAKCHVEEHYNLGLTPIMLYPETVSGNPLEAPMVARWVLNFPGLLGGDASYAPDEICFGYSRELAAAAGHPGRVLHMPTVDTRLFYPPAGSQKREGGCFFASKYQVVHGGKLFPITRGCVEITRQFVDSPTAAQVADLLRRSEVFYAYENTALATEAVLCGCPAVFLPNPHLTEVIGRKELGPEGYAWGASPEEIERARATVSQGAINYLKTYDIFHDQLDEFIAITQERAARIPYDRMLKVTLDSSFAPPPRRRVRKVWYIHHPNRVWKELRRTVRNVKRGVFFLASMLGFGES